MAGYAYCCVDYEFFSKSRFATFCGVNRRRVEKKLLKSFSTASTINIDQFIWLRLNQPPYT